MNTQSGLSLQLEYALRSIPANTKRVILAFSGGLDSCVLLHLVHSSPRPFSIQLWHINHGLQDIASDMESFCRSVAKLYKLKIRVSHLSLGPDMANLESEARKARYAQFEQGLTSDDCLFTAHHADDQAETIMLNLMRGSGSTGLRGIAYLRPIGRSIVLRPMLDISRNEIMTYAADHRLEWYDDPSNLSHRFNRNYLRQQVIPKIKSRWPGYLSSIKSVVTIQTETQQVLDEIGGQDYQNTRRQTQSENRDLLCCKTLAELTFARQKNLIRYWLKKYDCASLPQGRLNELIKQLKARCDAMPVVSNNDYDIRIYNQCLYIVEKGSLVPIQETYDFSHSLTLKINELKLEVKREAILHRLQVRDDKQSISVRFRINNKLNPDAHRLKRLFQKHKIPPWRRPLTPQIYLNGKLADLWL